MARKPNDGDDKKTVTDLKRGKASENHQVPVDGDTDTKGHNSFEPKGDTLDELMALEREADAKIAELREKMRLKCEPERQKIKEWKDKTKEARDQLVGDGYPAAELNIMVADLKDDLKKQRRREEMDPVQKKRHAAMERAWNDFRSTPLGAAADGARQPEAVH